MSKTRPTMAHPGPRAQTRVETLSVALKPITGTLRAGQVLMAEVDRLFREAGLYGGVLTLSNGHCDPFHYVIPDESPDAQHAAWYSRTYAPAGGATIEAAVAIVGMRDGARFLHAHGRWTPAEAGLPAAGHILPFDTILAEDMTVSGLGSVESGFDSLPDPETNFTLFTPAGSPSDQGSGLFLRLRPAEDVVSAIETACSQAGIDRARVHGIGSVNHVVYADGRTVPCHATEIYIEGGRVEDGRATLPVTVVDIAGSVTAGELLAGDNPVGVTFEIVVEADRSSDAVAAV